MWDLIVSVPDHCLSFYFGEYLAPRDIFFFFYGIARWVKMPLV